MNKVLRYPIEITDKQILRTAPGPIVHIGIDQSHTPCIWILATIDSQPTDVERVIFMCRTGDPIPARDRKHVGSLIMQTVWHLFEVE